MKIPAARIVIPAEDVTLILEQIRGSLETGQLTIGKHVRGFEEEFASYLGVRHAVAVGSGTAALEIILRILNVAGRDVIIPTNTFFATAAAVAHAGGVIRFVDVNRRTLCLDAETLRATLTDRTAAVIIVHIGGMMPPDLGDMARLCAERGVPIVEDAAHAHGSSIAGRKAGTFGVAAAFSFYPTKVITSAEGGMVVTNERAIYDEALCFRDQGKAGFSQNVHTRLGYNWRMSELHAIVGRSQLRRLDDCVAGRRAAAAWYDRALDGLQGVTRLELPAEVSSNYYKYPIVLDEGIDRDQLKRCLRESWSVSLSGEVYELPCHQQPVFTELCGEQSLPVAEEVCRRHVCLPVYAGMRPEEVQAVVDALARVLADLGKAGGVKGGPVSCLRS